MNTTTLFVHGLAKTVEEQELEGYFSFHGYVQSVKVARNEQTGKSLGYGFVRMQDPRAAQAAITLQNLADAERAIQVLNGYTVNERAIRACLFTPRV